MRRSLITAGPAVGLALLAWLPGAGVAAPPPKAGATGVTAAASVTRVVFGRTVVISGQVSEQKAAGTEVTVEQTPAPFTAPFTPVGTAATDAAGAYSLTLTPTVTARYQASAKTKPPSTSPVIQVDVAPAIGFRVGDALVRRGRRVRFSGRVRPAHDGAQVQIQRRSADGWRTVAQAALAASATAGESVYSKRVRVRRKGTYRVTLPADADHADGRSRKRTIRVR